MNKFRIGDRVSIREDSASWKDKRGEAGTVTMTKLGTYEKGYIYCVCMDYFPANPGHLLGEDDLQFHYE